MFIVVLGFVVVVVVHFRGRSGGACSEHSRRTLGAFHCAKISGNFGRNINGTLGGNFPEKVVHL